jgi:hypothetical protein
MCFTLHIATDCELPRLAWNEADRHVWVGDLDEYSKAVKGHFSLPLVAYVGSDLNCGCGFRHFGFQNCDSSGDEEWLVSEGFVNTEDTEQNHRELHAVLVDALRRSPVVELYGCWAGEYGEETGGEREIEPGDVLSDRFFLRERVLYRLRAKADSGP